MRSLALLASFLPAFLFPSSTTASPAYEWPNGVNPSVKYWPLGTGPPSKRWLAEYEENLRDNRSTRLEGLDEHPEASYCVRKMGFDPEEKFYDHYWSWGAEEHMEVLGLREAFSEEKRGQADAVGDAGGLDKRHGERLDVKRYNPPQRRSKELSPAGILALLKRQTNFECATGTYACTSIGRPGSCCAEDERCERITDTGFGDVGCCPNGQQCQGTLDGCGSDKITCSRDIGGGCCIQGTVCTANGCVAESLINSGNPTVTVSNATPTPTTCSSGYYACPSNLAGGCCPSGRICGVTDCPAPTVTENPNLVGDTCPTGYYSCAPAFSGGCCRIGRDCGITNCPARTTGVSNVQGANGGVLAPTDQGGCATGWVTCAAGVGGGCCPIGYECGVTDCPARTIMGSGLGVAGQATTLVLPETTKLPATATAAAVVGRKAGVREVIVAVVVVVGVVG